MTGADDLEYRIVGRGGIVVVTLRSGEGLLAEPGGLLYRRGGVGWSLASTGRNVLGRFLNRAMRRAAAAGSLMHHYEGPGELALAGRSRRFLGGDHAVCRRRHSLSHLPGHRAPIETGTALGAAARRCAGIRSRRDGGDGSLETGQVMSGVTGSPEVFHWNLTRECTVLSANDLHCKVAAVHCLDRLMPEAGETLN